MIRYFISSLELAGPSLIRAFAMVTFGRRGMRRHDRLHRAHFDSPVAMRAGQRGLRAMPTFAMHQCQRRPLFPRHPGVAPSHQADQHRIEVEAFFREPIFGVALGAVIVALENPFRYQRLQPRAQNIARDTGRGLEFVEAAMPEKSLTQDQHGPSLSDHGESARDRTPRLFDRTPLHLRDTSSPKLTACPKQRFYSCKLKLALLGFQFQIETAVRSLCVWENSLSFSSVTA